MFTKRESDAQDHASSEWERRNDFTTSLPTGVLGGGYAKQLDEFKASSNPLDTAIKNDDGKLRYDLIPPEAMEALAEVYTIGAKKYADRNWELGMKWSRIFRALMSHSWKWFRGELRDPKDGQLHMASVMWCAAALIAYEARKVGTDDRVKVSSIVEEVVA